MLSWPYDLLKHMLIYSKLPTWKLTLVSYSDCRARHPKLTMILDYLKQFPRQIFLLLKVIYLNFHILLNQLQKHARMHTATEVLLLLLHQMCPALRGTMTISG